MPEGAAFIFRYPNKNRTFNEIRFSYKRIKV